MTLSEKTQGSPSDYVLYDSIYITLSKWQSCRGGKQMCAAKGLGKGDCDYKGVGSRMMLLGGVKTVLNLDFGGGYMDL